MPDATPTPRGFPLAQEVAGGRRKASFGARGGQDISAGTARSFRLEEPNFLCPPPFPDVHTDTHETPKSLPASLSVCLCPALGPCSEKQGRRRVAHLHPAHGARGEPAPPPRRLVPLHRARLHRRGKLRDSPAQTQRRTPTPTQNSPFTISLPFKLSLAPSIFFYLFLLSRNPSIDFLLCGI